MSSNNKIAVEYSVAFGKRLKEIRESLALPQKYVAEKIGVAVSTYANWEQGRREPCLFDIKNIIAVLGIDANELFLQ